VSLTCSFIIFDTLNTSLAAGRRSPSLFMSNLMDLAVKHICKNILDNMCVLPLIMFKDCFFMELMVDVGSTFRFHGSELWEHCSGGSNSRQ
jgi:hypothetical protein